MGNNRAAFQATHFVDFILMLPNIISEIHEKRGNFAF